MPMLVNLHDEVSHKLETCHQEKNPGTAHMDDEWKHLCGSNDCTQGDFMYDITLSTKLK